MRVLLTGADGYIGIRMGHYLLERGHDVVGLDSGFHRVGWLYNSDERRPEMITMDTRHVAEEDLAGFDAVVHLADISNDPVGELNAGVTYEINHRGTVALAEKAKRAGVSRFVHMSSCSVYGSSGARASKEGDPTEPLTAYAKCKLLVEEDVGAMASDGFSPTFLRNATAYGASARQRFDLVVNDLAATAFVYREIRMTSDGSPWRPFVHVLDISHAVSCVLEAPQEVVHGEIFNVGSEEQNYQIRQIAEIISDLVPELHADGRRLFSRRSQLPRGLHQDPRAPARVPLRLGRGAGREGDPRDVRPHRLRRGDVPLAGPHPDQADPAPPGDRPDRRRLLLAPLSRPNESDAPRSPSAENLPKRTEVSQMWPSLHVRDTSVQFWRDDQPFFGGMISPSRSRPWSRPSGRSSPGRR